MALTCNQPGLNLVLPGSVNNLSPKQKLALLVNYYYRQKNPSTVGQVIPADTLLSQAACFDCGVSESLLQSYEVVIQRQAAIDAGANETNPWNPTNTLSTIQCLTCLPEHRLRAILVMLKCQVS